MPSDYYPAPALLHRGSARHEYQSTYGKYGEIITEALLIDSGDDNADVVAYERHDDRFNGDWHGFNVNGAEWERGDWLIVPNGEWETPRWVILKRFNSDTEYESLTDAMEAITAWENANAE